MALYTLFEINSNTDISKIRLEGLRDRNVINQLILQGCWWEHDKENNGNICCTVYIYIRAKKSLTFCIFLLILNPFISLREKDFHLYSSFYCSKYKLFLISVQTKNCAN